MKNFKKLLLICLFIALAISLSACGSKDVEVAAPKPDPVVVKGQAFEESLSVKQELSYPGVIVAESESIVYAKSAGNLTSVNFKVGDKTTLGQELAKIDDVNLSLINYSSNNYNNNQIKQAKLLVAQAEGGYNLARDSYNSLLISSVKDLRQAEIAKEQAVKGQSNLNLTAEESIKSAELAYETAKIAASQAKLTLENREKQVKQSEIDVITNANLAISSVMSTVSSLVTNINNATAFDDNNNVSISYQSNLGALDSSSYNKAKDSYQKVKEENDKYSSQKFVDINEKIDFAINAATLARYLADDTKNLFDKTITSSSLPQSSVSGPSLSSLQTAASAYQAQINAALSQISGAKQSLTNNSLNNTSLIDSLRQANDLANQQEASALQALSNLKAGNTSQADSASFVSKLAQNQYDNLRVKIESQVAAAKMQMDTAKIQYDNALVSLQNLYDNHSVVSPLNGTITKVFVKEREYVSPGQPIVTISETENIKVQFFVEPENLLAIIPGTPASVVDDKGQVYSGIVAAVSPQADLTTRRFLAELKLEKVDNLFLGTIVTVNLNIVKKSGGTDIIILPLSAVTVGQNGSYVFVFDNGLAKKASVEVREVIGNLAKVQGEIGLGSIIIIEGNKLLNEGQEISIIK